MTASNITPHKGHITKADRRRIFGHGGAVVWLTGLSGSGKSSIAYEVERRLVERGVHAFVLDGDNVRQGLNRDLGFSAGDRAENIRRVSHVATLMAEAGLVVITAFISPFRRDREGARALLPPGEFFEVFLRCPLKVCESRDPKGLYRRARTGEVSEFTGIDSPYEEPEDPELLLDTAKTPVPECSARILALLAEAGIISGERRQGIDNQPDN